jgi:pyruvate/2-oxoglutarate dehydrogenase complex dihydrolipoamide acyltransferase (E2) component
MPQLGESVHEGTISKWFVQPGKPIVEFQPLLEVDTDKVSAEVPAPVSGILREILATEGQTVQAGAPIAVVEVVPGYASETGPASTSPRLTTTPAAVAPTPGQASATVALSPIDRAARPAGESTGASEGGRPVQFEGAL